MRRTFNSSSKPTAFGLPNGNSRPLQPPKTKTIVLSAQTLLHVRGALERKVALTALRAGDFAIVAGPDDGTGKDLTAREIAVWREVQNGAYIWNDPAAPNTTPLNTTPPDAATGPQPVELHGDFEKLNELGRPVGWNFAKNANMSIQQDEKGNHFVHVTSDNPNQDRVFATTLKLDPSLWRTLELSRA